jgi:hypothetical protein
VIAPLGQDGIAQAAKFGQVAAERIGKNPVPMVVRVLPSLATVAHMLKEVL